MRFLRLPLALLVLVAPALRAATPAPAAATPPGPPLPYLSEPTLGGLTFEKPLGLVSAPGETNRLFVLEKAGRVQVIPDLVKPEKKLFLDLTKEVVRPDGDSGLMSLAFHPNYKTNRQFYVWFTHAESPAGMNVLQQTFTDILARFTTSTSDPDQADKASQQELLTQADRGHDHNGGTITFGPEGYLYTTNGDEAGQRDRFENSQRIDKNFFSGVFRFDVDLRPGNLKPNPHPAVHEGTYLVPKDNPFVGATSFNGAPVVPAAVRTELFAVGFRNPWQMAFDSATGLLWLADVGQDTEEEVDIVKRGGNYGWNYREGDIQLLQAAPPAPRGRGGRRGAAGAPAAAPGAPAAAGQGAPAPVAAAAPPPAPAVPAPQPPVRVAPAGLTFDEPLYTYGHGPEGGLSITGGFVYHGKALPALNGRYLFADYINGWIWALSPVDGKGGKVTVEKIARRAGIAAFGLDPRTGDVLLVNHSSGRIERLVPNPAAAAK